MLANAANIMQILKAAEIKFEIITISNRPLLDDHRENN
jgi:hypothetical protein